MDSKNGIDRNADQPSARSTVDGVETWDLTSRPSAADVGIATDSDVAIYETDDPRTVVLMLAEEAQIETPTRFVAFDRLASDDQLSLGLRGPSVSAEELVGQLSELAEQLDLPQGPVDKYADELKSAPADQSERIKYRSPETQVGGVTFTLAADLAPMAGVGRFTLDGIWAQPKQ